LRHFFKPERCIFGFPAERPSFCKYLIFIGISGFGEENPYARLPALRGADWVSATYFQASRKFVSPMMILPYRRAASGRLNELSAAKINPL
jgi:hypothetical protein